MQTKTVNHLLNNAQLRIGRDAQILLAHVLRRDLTFVLAHPEHKVGFFARQKFYWLVAERTRGIPLAYILGHKEFFGLDFIVNKHTLIPRPETELMVEIALEYLNKNSNTTVIDIGTGSGCIPIAIAKNTQVANIFAVDISKKALKMAQKNATNLQVNVNFLHSNLLSKINPKTIGQSVLITANLPYLTDTEFVTEPSIQHEPRTALVAAQNGLALYFALFKQLQTTWADKKITVLCEVNPQQVPELSTDIKTIFPHAYLRVRPDLAGLDRVVEATF